VYGGIVVPSLCSYARKKSAGRAVNADGIWWDCRTEPVQLYAQKKRVVHLSPTYIWWECRFEPVRLRAQKKARRAPFSEYDGMSYRACAVTRAKKGAGRAVLRLTYGENIVPSLFPFAKKRHCRLSLTYRTKFQTSRPSKKSRFFNAFFATGETDLKLIRYTYAYVARVEHLRR
jgi:hypothetical protein